MSEAPMLYTMEENVARITINREGQRNAITPEAIDLFLKFLDRAQEDEDVRAVLITGAGDKAFCTGAQLGDGMSAEGQAVFQNYAQLLKRIALFPKPTVARVKGYCLAGGMGFMLACDIVIAGEESQFGTPEVNVGLWPMMIGALIFRNVPRKKALEMILLGERLDAAEAMAMGLITRAVPTYELEGVVERVLRRLVAKSPVGIRIGKEAFQKAGEMSLDEALDFLALKLADVAATEDAREGITAFMEKRQPVFKGK